MPYAALQPVSGPAQRGLAEARWAAMESERPDLSGAIALQRQLIGLVGRLAETVANGTVPGLTLPPRYLTTKLASGVPALVGEPIQMPVSTVRPTLLALVNALAEAGAGDATTKIRDAFAHNIIDMHALLMLVFRRDQPSVKAASAKAELPHDLLWLVADLAAAPVAHAFLERLFDAVSPVSGVRVELDRWTKGYCPLCGSWPVVAEAFESNRRLRCSFCAAAWDVAGAACVYCGESGANIHTFAVDSRPSGDVVDACSSCRAYTKVIAVRESAPFPLVALSDLASIELDVAAIQRGFARPAIRPFAKR